MAFLFKRNPKTPPEVIRALNDQVVKLETTSDKRKTQDDVARYLKQVKIILHGDDETDPQPDQITTLAQEVYQSDCLHLLILNLKNLDFDSRKDVLIVFSTLLRRQIGSRSPTVDYLLSKPEIINNLIRGPESIEIGLVCGQILRDCIKSESINKFVLNSQYFWNYFKYVQISTFEISTDAFTTFSDLLTLHPKLVSEFLTEYYDSFTANINNLIQSENYVIKRQSTRLLSQLVSKLSNRNFLNKYVDDPKNLKITMMLLSDKSKNLQLEGFHIFKVFAAKPKKTKPVSDILIKNKENFIEFFKNFDVEKFNDINLSNEKNYIVSEIEKLPDIEKKSPVNNSNSNLKVYNDFPDPQLS